MEKIKFRPSLFIYLACAYMCVGLISNIAGLLLPQWQKDFHLSTTVLTFLNSMMFIALGLTALPHGFITTKIGQKKAFIVGFAIIAAGSLFFAVKPTYITGLISLFVIGTGVAALQVSGAVLIKKISDYEEEFPKNMTSTQLFYGLGSASGGIVLSFLLSHLKLPWSYTYYIFAIVLCLMIIAGIFVKVPQSEGAKEKTNYKYLIKQPFAIIFCLGIFTYLGIEISFATWLPTFLMTIKSYSMESAFKFMSLFWVMLAAGRLLGGLLMKKISAAKLLITYSLLAPFFVALGVFHPDKTATLIGFGVVALLCSIMFPVIFSYAINFAGKENESSMAGLLCLCIIGGAVAPPIIGVFSNLLNSLTLSILICTTISFFYTLFIGYYAHKKA